MAYLVVACQGCGAPKVAEEGRKTTQCPRCSHRIAIGEAIVHARTETVEQARHALGQVNASKAGGELAQPAPAEPTRDAVDRALIQARSVTAKASRVRLAAEGLTREFETFTHEQWLEALARLDILVPEAREHLDRLKQANLVAEPEHGVYRFVA